MKGYVLLKYHAPDGRCLWLKGGRPLKVIHAHTHSEVLPTLAEVERAVQRGLTAVGFVAYEAAHSFDSAFPKAQAGLPLLWFGVYERLIEPSPLGSPLKRGNHSAFSVPKVSQGESKGGWTPTLAQAEYEYAIQRIRAYIAAGDVYQVNYTFRLRAPFEGDPLALFCRLYRVQPVPYAAYIDTGEHAILSLSPELFFALDGERIVSRPMKGTAPRGLTLEDDWKQARVLRGSEKNRAENLMIVDMVRNDLGRIAKVGAVRVPSLFETERYATLWQMTSTVEAQTRAPLGELFRALFPAASITGAPKIRATQIIHELETTPRGVYTGAIGIVLPGRRAQFNVAIRTLVYDWLTGSWSTASAAASCGIRSKLPSTRSACSKHRYCLRRARSSSCWRRCCGDPDAATSCWSNTLPACSVRQRISTFGWISKPSEHAFCKQRRSLETSVIACACW